MHDAALMQRRQRGQHAKRDRYRLRHAQRALPQSIGQRLAFEQLHRDEEITAVFTDLVDLADVRVIDACCRTRLTPEALPRRLVVRQRGHCLERHAPSKPFVARGIHHTHAAFAELALYRIVPDPRRHDLSWSSGITGYRGCRRRAPDEPFIKRADAFRRCLLYRLVPHSTSILGQKRTERRIGEPVDIRFERGRKIFPPRRKFTLTISRVLNLSPDLHKSPRHERCKSDTASPFAITNKTRHRHHVRSTGELSRSVTDR